MDDKSTSEQRNIKSMGMLLQDPSLLDDKGEYLHTYYEFPLEEDTLFGTSSSKFTVREEELDEKGVPRLYPADPAADLDWGDSKTELSYDDFNKRPRERPL